MTDVSAGAEHSVALLCDGHVFGWGSNNFDQLANKFVSESLKPTLIIINVEEAKQGEAEEEEQDVARAALRNYVRSIRDEEQK